MLRPLAVALALVTPSTLCAQNVRLNVIGETLSLNPPDIVSAEPLVKDGQWSIMLKLTPGAGAMLGAITKRNEKKPMQIVIGDRILATGIITTEISGGSVLITGGFTEASAKELAARIKP